MEYVQAGVLSTIAALLKAMEEGRRGIGVRTDLAAGAAIGRRHKGGPNEKGAPFLVERTPDRSAEERIERGNGEAKEEREGKKDGWITRTEK